MYAYMENMKTITIFAIISPHSAMCILLKLLLLTIFLLIAQSENAAKVFDGISVIAVFDGISVIARQWEGENEMLCAMEPQLRVERFSTSSRSQTPNRQINRPVLKLLSCQFQVY